MTWKPGTYERRERGSTSASGCRRKVVTAVLSTALSPFDCFACCVLHNCVHTTWLWALPSGRVSGAAGWVHGRIYYYPYQNNAETMPSEEESSRHHPVHTFDLTQQPSTMHSAGGSPDADETDPAGQRCDLVTEFLQISSPTNTVRWDKPCQSDGMSLCR